MHRKEFLFFFMNKRKNDQRTKNENFFLKRRETIGTKNRDLIFFSHETFDPSFGKGHESGGGGGGLSDSPAQSTSSFFRAPEVRPPGIIHKNPACSFLYLFLGTFLKTQNGICF